MTPRNIFTQLLVTSLLLTIVYSLVYLLWSSRCTGFCLCLLGLSLVQCAHAPRATGSSTALQTEAAAQAGTSKDPDASADILAPATVPKSSFSPDVRPMRLAADANASALVSAAQQAFSARTELKQLQRAIAQWEQLHGLEPDDASVALSLSRAYFLLGDSFYKMAGDGGAEIMQDAFERGALAGEQALMSLSPAFADKLSQGASVEDALLVVDKTGLQALAYYAQNLTAFAVARGIPTMLLYRRRVQTLVEQIIKVDETFLYGVAYRVRGTFMAAAPSFAGGSLSQARSAFMRAQVLAPAFLPNALAMAEGWAVRAADKAGFVRTLTDLIRADASVPAEFAPEQALTQKRAAWLLHQVECLF